MESLYERVLFRLLESLNKKNENNLEEDEEIKEFSTVSGGSLGAAGTTDMFSLPIGMASSHDLNKKSNSKKNKSKKKSKIKNNFLYAGPSHYLVKGGATKRNRDFKDRN